MKWLVLWLLLTGSYLAGQLLCGWLAGPGLSFDGEDLANLLAVPLTQTAALRALTAFRRMFRQD